MHYIFRAGCGMDTWSSDRQIDSNTVCCITCSRTAEIKQQANYNMNLVFQAKFQSAVQEFVSNVSEYVGFNVPLDT